MKTIHRFLISLLVAAAGLLPRSGSAATSEGSLITNLACATYTLSLGSGPMVTISYCATSIIQVATPCLMLRKSGNTTLQAAGGTVTFCITFSNCSTWASAMNVVITDVKPDNTRFINTLPGCAVYEPEGSIVTTAWSSNGGAAWSPGGAGYAGYPLPPVETWPNLILKWTVDALGPGKSGYVCYTVSIL